MNVALIGATGVVGETILRVLEERALPVTTLRGYAARARDAAITFRGASLPVAAASAERILAARPDVAFCASSDDASAELVQALATAGVVVIDNAATFRLDPHIALIVPEVNAHAVHAAQRIFPVANCTAIVLCIALAPIEREVGLRSVRVATYQAVSGAGRAGLDALAGEEQGAVPNGTFAAPIVRNVVPQVGAFDGEGETGEEHKIVAETRKMLNRPDLSIGAFAVRVPVRCAHSEAVFFETEKPIGVAQLAAALASAPGVVFHPHGIVTPREVEGTDLVHVARLHTDSKDDTQFKMWIVGDQLRKGAATNAVQILELLIAGGRFACAST